MLIQGLGRNWAWPREDRECLQVIFSSLPDALAAAKLCKRRRTVVQAGGNCGVWPWALAHCFESVVTFEPDSMCFGLLQENLHGTLNIEAHNQALWDTPGTCGMYIEPHNRGAQWVLPDEGGIPCTTIDSLRIGDCDMIYLDIEGAELKALRGAAETIAHSRPVIAVEDKGHSLRYGSQPGDIERWLIAEFGYKVVARPHRDVVLTCE